MTLQQLAILPAHVVPDIAENPLFVPTMAEVKHKRGDDPTEQRQIIVLRTLKDDPVGQMYRRGHLGKVTSRTDGTVVADERVGSQAMVLLMAARKWQQDYEMAGATIRSSGFLQEPVDGGGQFRDGITDRQLKARDRLEAYRKLFGETRGHELITAVLADKQTIWGATVRLFPHDVTMQRRRFCGEWFRECLMVLAKKMGLSS